MKKYQKNALMGLLAVSFVEMAWANSYATSSNTGRLAGVISNNQVPSEGGGMRV